MTSGKPQRPDIDASVDTWADYLGSIAVVGLSTNEAAACGVALLPILREIVLCRTETEWRYSPLARRAACIAVGRMTPPTAAAAEFLASVLDADEWFAVDVAIALQGFGAVGRCAVPALLKRAEVAERGAFGARDFDFIAEFPFVLASIGGPEAMAWLRHQLETEKRPLMLSIIVNGIARAGDAPAWFVDSVRRLLVHENERVRRRAVAALARFDE